MAFWVLTTKGMLALSKLQVIFWSEKYVFLIQMHSFEIYKIVNAIN